MRIWHTTKIIIVVTILLLNEDLTHTTKIIIISLVIILLHIKSNTLV